LAKRADLVVVMETDASGLLALVLILVAFISIATVVIAWPQVRSLVGRDESANRPVTREAQGSMTMSSVYAASGVARARLSACASRAMITSRAIAGL
jgi:hypothetical protein